MKIFILSLAFILYAVAQENTSVNDGRFPVMSSRDHSKQAQEQRLKNRKARERVHSQMLEAADHKKINPHQSGRIKRPD